MEDRESALPFVSPRARNYPISRVFQWLGEGWRIFKIDAGASIAYGTGIFILSVIVIWSLFKLDIDYIMFPALAGFMVVAPFLAIGLYEKARLIETGEPVSLAKMFTVHAKSGGQVLFIGVILMLLMATWLRAAVIVYALFFGVHTFPGLGSIAPMLFATPTGWAMLFTGAVVGGLFAAFSFAIGAVSIPMLLDQRTDAFTAMGTSISTVWNNRPVMIAWGFVVLIAFIICVVTFGLALVILFPLLGHATWFVYRDTK
jgi:uncharacterized membrane protein